ncbi:hypothetical protein FOMG_19565 [Fusarium oxysporum f. sp. melonis 26406]|uniref:Uncharacterized protein n=1 Tax=Fusarium oxysporum f. sp. melonis 26406 TaxID=1089452 RepID=W9YVS7_FUSOX|nr:hypothetical protein FOMG_19565 [Fusarium oxysporum f. sp. melonis 26406]
MGFVENTSGFNCTAKSCEIHLTGISGASSTGVMVSFGT